MEDGLLSIPLSVTSLLLPLEQAKFVKSDFVLIERLFEWRLVGDAFSPPVPTKIASLLTKSSSINFRSYHTKSEKSWE